MATKITDIDQIQTGDTIKFGNFRWEVTDVEYGGGDGFDYTPPEIVARALNGNDDAPVAPDEDEARTFNETEVLRNGELLNDEQ